MTELAANLSDLIWAFVIATIFVIGFLWLFVRRAIANLYDPLLWKGLLLFSTYLAGVLVVPHMAGDVTVSYWVILFFIFVFLVIVRLFPVVNSGEMRLGICEGFVRLLVVTSILVCVLNVVVNMVLPGAVPLFSESAGAGRFDATTNSRLLYWMANSIVGVSVVVYAISTDKVTRRLSLFAFFVEFLASVLFASKGALLQVTYLLLFCAFVAKQRNDRPNLQKYKRLLVASFVFALIVGPAYLVAVTLSASGGELLTKLGVRIFGGFDQLIPAISSDMASGFWPDREFGLGIFEYQLLPYMKVVLGVEPHYSSVGQYVVEAWTGRFIEGPYTMPNSNLILESIFTSGVGFGFFIYVAQLVWFYFLRQYAMRGSVTVLRLMLIKTIVYSPMSLFYSGQEFWSYFVLFVSIVTGLYACWCLVALVARPRDGASSRLATPSTFDT